jgi:hypothetical protein
VVERCSWVAVKVWFGSSTACMIDLVVGRRKDAEIDEGGRNYCKIGKRKKKWVAKGHVEVSAQKSRRSIRNAQKHNGGGTAEDRRHPLSERHSKELYEAAPRKCADISAWEVKCAKSAGPARRHRGTIKRNTYGEERNAAARYAGENAQIVQHH